MAPRILVVDDNQELLSLLTQLFEDAGYDVIAASRGKQAIEAVRAGAPPQAAVLDILLPDMMGYNLADALRKDVPQLPLLFITGVFKGGKHSTEARQKYAAAGYFEKPFEAQKLLEAVAKILPAEKKKPAASSLQDAFEVELDIDVEEEGPQDVMELTGRIKVTGGDNLTAELRGANLTASPMQKSPSTLVRPPTADRPPPPPPAALTPGSRRGELRDNLPSLFTAFFLSRETGELGVQRGKVKKVVYFEKGTPVFALSNLLADRFGQFLVRVGKIKPEQLQDAMAVATQTNRRTGDVLIERGLLKDTERLYYIGQQVKAIIYSLFAWEDGTYVMSFKEKASTESIKLDVHPANLIVRGIKKLYKPERLRRLLQPEDRLLPAVAPAYQLNEVELERWEADLLPKIDGNRTVAELLAYANRPEHVVYGFLVSMMSLGILERRA
jgi:CheY-like chemotaxis protein